MYHVIASIGGTVRRYDLPKGKGTPHCPADVQRYAVEAFSHASCEFVAVADVGGIIGYVSHTGQRYL